MDKSWKEFLEESREVLLEEFLGEQPKESCEEILEKTLTNCIGKPWKESHEKYQEIAEWIIIGVPEGMPEQITLETPERIAEVTLRWGLEGILVKTQ